MGRFFTKAKQPRLEVRDPLNLVHFYIKATRVRACYKRTAMQILNIPTPSGLAKLSSCVSQMYRSSTHDLKPRTKLLKSDKPRLEVTHNTTQVTGEILRISMNLTTLLEDPFPFLSN
jgi:hypothetical protein